MSPTTLLAQSGYQNRPIKLIVGFARRSSASGSAKRSAPSQ
jgi:hypothetical protein